MLIQALLLMWYQVYQQLLVYSRSKLVAIIRLESTKAQKLIVYLFIFHQITQNGFDENSSEIKSKPAKTARK